MAQVAAASYENPIVYYTVNSSTPTRFGATTLVASQKSNIYAIGSKRMGRWYLALFSEGRTGDEERFVHNVKHQICIDLGYDVTVVAESHSHMSSLIMSGLKDAAVFQNTCRCRLSGEGFELSFVSDSSGSKPQLTPKWIMPFPTRKTSMGFEKQIKALIEGARDFYNLIKTEHGWKLFKFVSGFDRRFYLTYNDARKFHTGGYQPFNNYFWLGEDGVQDLSAFNSVFIDHEDALRSVVDVDVESIKTHPYFQQFINSCKIVISRKMKFHFPGVSLETSENERIRVVIAGIVCVVFQPYNPQGFLKEIVFALLIMKALGSFDQFVNKVVLKNLER